MSNEVKPREVRDARRSRRSPAYSPPYDHALAACAGALRRRRAAGHELAFALRPRARARSATDAMSSSTATPAAPAGSQGCARSASSPSPRRRHAPLPARAARDADVVHFEWLTVPRRTCACCRSARRCSRSTIRSSAAASSSRCVPSAFARVDAVVVHTEYAREHVIAQHRLDPERVHVIRHGALRPRGCDDPGRASRLTAELATTTVAGGALLRPDPPVQGDRDCCSRRGTGSPAPSCGSSAGR